MVLQNGVGAGGGWRGSFEINSFKLFKKLHQQVGNLHQHVGNLHGKKIIR